MLRLILELVRRAGRAANFAITAIAGLLAAIALSGSAIRGLIDGGTVPAERLGVIRADFFSVYPMRWNAIVQITVAGLAIVIATWGLLARRN